MIQCGSLRPFCCPSVDGEVDRCRPRRRRCGRGQASTSKRPPRSVGATFRMPTAASRRVSPGRARVQCASRLQARPRSTRSTLASARFSSGSSAGVNHRALGYVTTMKATSFCPKARAARVNESFLAGARAYASRWRVAAVQAASSWSRQQQCERAGAPASDRSAGHRSSQVRRALYGMPLTLVARPRIRQPFDTSSRGDHGGHVETHCRIHPLSHAARMCPRRLRPAQKN
jgi:hypothetical protein